jgi:hypothetical protein
LKKTETATSLSFYINLKFKPMMKKVILFLVFMPLLAVGQDVIYTHIGDKILCKITKVTDSVIYLEQKVGEMTIAKYIKRESVANYSIGIIDKEVNRMPSDYLRRAGNFQMASFLLAGVGVGGALAIKDSGGTIIAVGTGLFSAIFYLCGAAQLGYASDAFKRIEVNSNGVIIKF